MVSSDKGDILSADAVILPGVGAFAGAMHALARLDLVNPLREVAASGTPLVGICLGMQLLMTESEEFGRHRGLDLIPGGVVRFQSPPDAPRVLKVPHVGWSNLERPSGMRAREAWTDTLLAGTAPGTPMYFVHSYYACPTDSQVVLSTTEYGGSPFCSSLRRGNVTGFQFHPEKSGPAGIRIYENIAALLRRRASSSEDRHAA
jgi:glutamine amidotransferase